MSEKRETILIVEDDEDLRLAMSVRLNKAGYDVVTANDAVAAVHKFRSEAPDLLILDIGLPGGGGFVVMQRIKKFLRGAPVPVVVVTARDPKEVEDRALLKGALEVLYKPVAAQDLLAKVSWALGRAKEGHEMEEEEGGERSSTSHWLRLVSAQ